MHPTPTDPGAVNDSAEQLFEAYLVGTLSDDGKIALAERLDADPATREAFLSFIEEAHDLAVVAREHRRRHNFLRRIPAVGWLAAAAAVALMAGSLLILSRSKPSQPGSAASAPPQPPVTVGRVIRGTLQLADPAGPVAIGERVPVGTARAKDEMVMIEFDSGSAVALFEWAKVQTIDSSTLRLLHGRLTGRTGGKARDLIVATTTLRITDLGTRFGVEQQSAGACEVHVLEGTVIISENQAEDRILPENEALRFSPGSPPQSIPIDRKRFEVTFPEPGSDGPAFVHYDFEDFSSGSLLDSGSGFEGGPFPLAPRHSSSVPRTVPGRFGRGLAFADGNALWSTFPGIAGGHARTVAFWVKPEATSRSMAVVSWGQIAEGRKWQIVLHYDAGSRELLPRTEFGDGWVTGSRNLADDAWHHFTSVYTGGNGSPVDQLVRHYIDGELIPSRTSESQFINTDVVSSQARRLLIGHHLDDPTGSYFTGLLDEVYVFDRALDQGEIRQLYEQNSPPPGHSR